MPCLNPQSQGPTPEITGQGDLFLVVSSDVIGKEADIGRILMKGFIETILTSRMLPKAMFFMNAGARLTTGDGEFLPLLKRLHEAGVEIYTCGTCLKYYGLEDGLSVGYRGSTGQLLELMQMHETVWIG